jgi:hypothetical protein
MLAVILLRRSTLCYLRRICNLVAAADLCIVAVLFERFGLSALPALAVAAGQIWFSGVMLARLKRA